MLWTVVPTAARAWVDYRYDEDYPKAKARMILTAGVLGGNVGFAVGCFEKHLQSDPIRKWFVETFDSLWWLLALFVLVGMWPELIARMRRREYRQLQRLTAVEAAAEWLGRQIAESELRLQFEVDVPDSLRDVELPPLVLLALVENPIKHGISRPIEGGTVQVSARDEDGACVRIVVADYGPGLDEIYLQAWSTHIRAAIHVNGVRIAGDAV